MNGSIFWCKRCLNMSTRPRIFFNKQGVCNACLWSEKKKTLNWTNRKNKFLDFLETHKSSGPYDCIVPVSGGKDGSYVAYKLRNEFGLKVLCVTVRPPIELDIGIENLNSFVNTGYEHLHLSPCKKTMCLLNKFGFIHQGRPTFGWTASIFTGVIKIASAFNIPLIVYGEDGEVEYGGTQETEDLPFISMEYIRKIYLSGEFEKTKNLISSSESSLNWFFWDLPKENISNIYMTHWSYFENWDPYRNYLIAKKYCGLKENNCSNLGTYTNFAQNDTYIYTLHTYLMYLKFGFGRATQDAGIDIRRGALSREQAIPLVEMYDNQPPSEEMIEQYLEYYEMTKEDYYKTLDKHANKDLFEKSNGTWLPLFKIV